MLLPASAPNPSKPRRSGAAAECALPPALDKEAAVGVSAARGHDAQINHKPSIIRVLFLVYMPRRMLGKEGRSQVVRGRGEGAEGRGERNRQVRHPRAGGDPWCTTVHPGSSLPCWREEARAWREEWRGEEAVRQEERKGGREHRRYRPIHPVPAAVGYSRSRHSPRRPARAAWRVRLVTCGSRVLAAAGHPA